MRFRSRAEPGKVSQCSALQLVAIGSGKGLCAMEMKLCVALLLVVRVTLVVPALTKKKPRRGIFFLVCFSECVKGKKPQPQTLLATTYTIQSCSEFQCDSHQRISFDNTVPENPSPAVSGKLIGTARAPT